MLQTVLAGLLLGAAPVGLALAADRPAALPVKAPRVKPVFDWSGFYVGGHVGYGGGSFGKLIR